MVLTRARIGTLLGPSIPFGSKSGSSAFQHVFLMVQAPTTFFASRFFWNSNNSDVFGSPDFEIPRFPDNPAPRELSDPNSIDPFSSAARDQIRCKQPLLQSQMLQQLGAFSFLGSGTHSIWGQLILIFCICWFAMSCENFNSCISMVKDSMGRTIQWMVKDSMDGEGINGWKGRRTQWMVQDSIAFISSSCGAHTAFFVAPTATGHEHNGKRPSVKKLNLPACEANRTKQIAPYPHGAPMREN